MTKQNKSLNDVMQGRNPLEMRQVITPVDILQTERPNPTSEPNDTTVRSFRSDEPNKRTDTPNERAERTNRSSTPKKRTTKPNTQSGRMHRTVFDDLERDTPEEAKRQTERYSFEIYTDQKESIEEVQYLFKKKTGKKLSASRIIREALEDYLTRALEALRVEKGKGEVDSES